MLPDIMYDYRHEEPKPVVVDTCFQCSRDICIGEEYYDFDGEIICEECLGEYVRHFKKEGEKNE